MKAIAMRALCSIPIVAQVQYMTITETILTVKKNFLATIRPYCHSSMVRKDVA